MLLIVTNELRVSLGVGCDERSARSHSPTNVASIGLEMDFVWVVLTNHATSPRHPNLIDFGVNATNHTDKVWLSGQRGRNNIARLILIHH
jgi:hypothetical protein